MIADAPYRFGEFALRPRAGAGAGLFGAVLMLGILAVLSPASGLQVSEVLTRIASVIPLGGHLAATPTQMLGLGVHAGVGAVLGLLYAAAQQSLPLRRLAWVGLFYGVLVWIVGGFIAGWAIDDILRRTIRSWPWLVACLGYGLTLAFTAAWAQARRVRPAAVAQPD